MPEDTSDINAMLSRLWDIAVRRRWWLLLTTCSVAVAVAAVSLALPNRYRSEATIVVEKQRVPERYVTPNTTTNAMQAIDAMTHEILSRTRLQQIIAEFGLYPDQRKRMAPEELVEIMRGDIEVKPLAKDPEKREMNAFVIAFTGNDRKTTQQVTGRITELFEEKYTQAQQDHDTGTTSFLESQLDVAKADLEKQEQALKDFKMKNLGQLPEQQQGNLQILSGLHMQLQNTQASLARAREQRTYLESMLSQYVPPSPPGGADVDPGVNPIEALQAEIAHLRSTRNDLLSRYSPRYPDVVSLNQRIAEEDAQLNRLTAAPAPQATTAAAAAPAAPAARVVTGPAAVELKSQLDANRLEIADAEKETERLKVEIADYQQRLNLTPVREEQLADVLRNYDLSKQNYADLLSKKTQSQLATSLGQHQEGEQFRVVDPPSWPLKPSSPQRQKIALGGLVVGLLLGAALGFLAEARDTSFHLENDARAHFSLPFVVGIPPLLTAAEEHMLVRRKILEWVSGSLLGLVILAAQFYIYRRG